MKKCVYGTLVGGGEKGATSTHVTTSLHDPIGYHACQSEKRTILIQGSEQ